MASAEQPLKKRKLYEPPPAPPSDPPPTNDEAPPPPPQTPPPLSHEEIVRRRRNHEEIRSVYESYKAIKRCVVSSGKRARHVPEIEQAYLALISASRGCASVHRVLSEFIPRYAKYCPTALEAAAQVIINMHNCNLPVVTRGEDADGVSFDTATNCIIGLVDVCHTASLEAPSSSVITGICSTVFLNVVTFFASSIDGNDILQIVDKESLKMQVCVETFSQLKQRVLEENASPFVKLLRLKALCFLKIFFLCPKDVLEACFGLFSTPHSADGVCREAKYVLRQLSDKLDSGHEIPLLDGNEVGLMKQCLLGEVLQRNHSLKKWIFSRYKRLRKFASPEAVSQVTVAFEGIFESFTELVKAQDVEDSDEEGPNPSKYTGGQYLVHRISDQCSPLPEVSGRDSASQIIDKSCRDESPNKIPRQYLKRHGSILSHENDRDHHSNSSSEQLLSPLLEKPSEIKSGPFEQGEKVVHHRTPKSKSSDRPPGGGQVIWFSDGDPAALDVFSATRQIWLGSLSPDISEASVRHELERFGPMENFSFFPVKGFALAEYRSITDATKAREFMRRYSPWGYPVRVKFIDVGLGTRGSIGGVAIGSSCHVFVGNVFNHWTKDEILQEMMKVVSRGPRVVADISSEGTLLLEFDSPEEAARGMACIRQLRRGLGNATDMSSARASYWNSAAAPGGNVLGSTCNTMLGSPHGQTGGSPNNRMNIAAVPSNMKMEGAPPEFVSPRAAFEQGFSIQGGQMTHSNMISSGCADTPGIGFTIGSMPAPPEQMWCWNPEVENHSASGSLTCTPIATHGPTIPPPHSIQPPPYNMQPVYPPPTTNSWDPHNLTHYPPRPMPIGPHSSTVPLPFVQPSVTSLSQIPGSGIQPYSQIAPMPIMVPHSAMMPPQPVMPPPPIPSSPPPPPPPPPDAGPPPPSTGLSSASSVVESLQIQWQGTLAKSGVHYCTVCAHRVDSDSCKYLVPVSEPTGWPVKLDMTKRTDFGHVQAAFTNTPPSRREVCELVPSSAADHKGFQDFISYLKQRGCAGVIKIPSAKSLWARLLFILPCSPEACTMLSVKSRTSDCLFAVVLPKEANSECA